MDAPAPSEVCSPPPGISGVVAALTPRMDSETPSLAALFEEEESGLLRFAVGLAGRRSVAEELVQEAFLRLHRSWAEVENPRAWLYRTVRNLALNHLRDHPRETELDPEAAPGEDRPAAERLGRDEAVGTVRLLLAELPAADRRLIHLKYHEELQYQEIGRRTGLSAGNVGFRLHHLLKALADGLRRAGIEGSEG